MRQRKLLGIDWWLLTPVVILLIISLVTLFSLSASLFFGQLISMILALVVFFIFSRVNLRSFERLALPIYIVSIILLTLIFILGFESKGATRWVSIFGISVQFSEVLKPFLSLALVSYLAKKDSTTFRTMLTVLLLLAPIFLLIALQPDLGNALIYLLVTGFILLVYGFPLKYFGILLLPFLLVSPVLWGLLHDYQRNRILTFVNPTSDPLGTSYNVIQAMIAVGSGMFLGKGLSQGTQSGLRFLPERHTDFIFATLSEGLGFVGSFIVLLCFIALCFRIYTLSQYMENQAARLFAVAAFGFILIHFFVNMGMNIGLLPIVGVTLPFVSYGGTSLLSNFIFLGILSSLAASYTKRSVLEIK